MDHDPGKADRGRAITAPTIGALALFLLVAGLTLSSGKDTDEYRTEQNALFAFVVLFSGLFLPRVMWMGAAALPRSLPDREGWRQYAKGGALAVDSAFLVSAAVFLLLADFGLWKSHGVRIGTVAAIVIVRLAISSVRGFCWRGSRRTH